MRYASFFSGIEAASVAWHPLGWEPVFFSEIEPFPNKVLAHHYPAVPNLGDITKIKNPLDYGAIDLMVGGSPCQSFSVAGLRKGLADPRGNLALEYLRMADTIQPRWIVWENVPGVLSSNGGRDFGAFLGALAELGYGFAYRVLDAQFFGVPQRRRRVFVVAHSGGDWQRSAAVLFEPESMRRDFTPGGKARKGIAPTLSARTKGGGGLGTDFELDGGLIGCWWDGGQISQTLDAVLYKGQTMPEKNRFPAVLQPKSIHQNQRNEVRLMDVMGALNQGGGKPGQGLPVIWKPQIVHPTLTAANDPSRSPQSSEITASVSSVYASSQVIRRITPMEAERLQGFPDNYTNIPGAKDTPRYRALGNSMAVPVMRWIGERIQKIESL